jgi:lipoprotein-anchoring transpeptidase ErfK/SrfK
MVRPSLATAFAVLLVASLGLMAFAATQRARQARPAAQRAVPAVAAAPAPAAAPVAAPAPAARPAPPRPPEHRMVRVRAGRTVRLHSEPSGRALKQVGARTEFGSPTTFAVARRSGRWLGVTSTDMPNGRLAWVRERGADLKGARTRIAIRVDLSQRRLELLSGRRVVRRASVGIGRPGSGTPTGRYAITDKLAGSAYGPYYGCCILALSGHQTRTPAGWRGGDRLAIHGTNDPSSVGVPSSAGCLHADADDLRVLMRRVPLGTPVFIRN